MGINVSIYRGSFSEEHPIWDYSRHAGDQLMYKVMGDGGCIRRNIGVDFDPQYLFRPVNVAEFVAAMNDEFPENADRWRVLGEILADQEWWLHFGH